jgi:arabinoxylan arabinofuranohydrolase
VPTFSIDSLKTKDLGRSMRPYCERQASAGSGGTLEFHLDSPTGALIASGTIPVTGGWQTWKTVSAPASGASGIHDLYMVFKGTTSIGNVNWFRFQ